MTDLQPQESVTQFFEDAASVYFSRYETPNPEGHSFRVRRDHCLDLLRQLPRGATVADVGAGPATFVGDLLKAGYQVVATDISPQMIADGRKRFLGHENVRFEVAPADRIPVADASLDAVTLMGVLEYLNDEGAIYREAYRALKPGGLLIVTYPHYWSPTRLWYRLVRPVAKPILTRLRSVQPASGLKHREYRLHDTIAQVAGHGFEVDDVLFYNFKLLGRPLDDWFPRATAWQSACLERFCRTPGLRRVGTGFIVRAVRK